MTWLVVHNYDPEELRNETEKREGGIKKGEVGRETATRGKRERIQMPPRKASNERAIGARV